MSDHNLVISIKGVLIYMLVVVHIRYNFVGIKKKKKKHFILKEQMIAGQFVTSAHVASFLLAAGGRQRVSSSTQT